MHTLMLGQQRLTLSDLARSLEEPTQLALTPQSRQAIEACRHYLDEKIKHSDAAFYGINTGFGSLCDIKVSNGDIEALQKNLVLSHACGMGPMVPLEVIRLMLLLKIQSLAQGHSGVSIAVVTRLMDFYHHDVLPVIYEQGSLGASGDLAPLAHLSLPLFNHGKVWYQGEVRDAAMVCAELGWAPLTLRSKEGLALLNGTQFMSALGVYALIQSEQLLDWANAISALSLDAFLCRTDPLHAALHQVRPHAGQVQVAARIRALLQDSILAQQPKIQVQDPYSFRCVPQVHGASWDALAYVKQVFTTEINAVTDNPTIFPEQDVIISGGNFHGQPLALGLDFLAIAMAEIASISERRLYLLLSGQRGLPMFLSPNPGLESGLMIVQYSAASMVSQNKQLATPASVDSIVSSNGQEDHVSMGANGATKLQHVVQNVRQVLALELFGASQALSFRHDMTAPALAAILVEFRDAVPLLTEDRLMHEDMVRAERFLFSQYLRFFTHLSSMKSGDDGV
ncbi:MAG: histidine ammonia-lyase [Neisseriaceae bacterium]|nr:histidine ammonia-lyase [Neisseriaceae bacterium]